MSDLLDKELDKINKLRKSIPIDKSEEEAWLEYLEKEFPKPVILGESNKVVNKQFIESTQVFVIVDKNFEIVNTADSIFCMGEFTKEVVDLLKKYNLHYREITFKRTIDYLKADLHNEFSISEIWKCMFSKPSSEKYIEFEKWVDVKNDEIEAILKEERKNNIKR
jgi:hypothetical protein